MPAIDDDRRARRLPVDSQVGQLAIGPADSFRIRKKIVVSAIAATPLPARIGIPFREIDIMVPARIGVNQNLSRAGHVLLTQKRSAGDVQKQIRTGHYGCQM